MLKYSDDIAAAIALGAGLQTTGAALTIAQGFIGLVGDSPYSLIAGLFILTAGFSAMISNCLFNQKQKRILESIVKEARIKSDQIRRQS